MKKLLAELYRFAVKEGTHSRFNWFLYKRAFRHYKQRLVRGWDDSDTWSLDFTLARIILPRLKRFRELNVAYPCDMASEEWDAILDEMIAGFEIIVKDDCFILADTETIKKAQRGIDLFAEHYFSLWW